jgi:hypothetical protein
MELQKSSPRRTDGGGGPGAGCAVTPHSPVHFHKHDDVSEAVSLSVCSVVNAILRAVLPLEGPVPRGRGCCVAYFTALPADGVYSAQF